MNTKFTAENLRKMSRLALYDLAKKLKIKGCTKFDKNQLITAVLQFADSTVNPENARLPRVARKQTVPSVATAAKIKSPAKKIRQPELPLTPVEHIAEAETGAKKKARSPKVTSAGKVLNKELPASKKAGRPAKAAESVTVAAPARKAGRPAKTGESLPAAAPAKKVGRPPKNSAADVVTPEEKSKKTGKDKNTDAVSAAPKKRGRPPRAAEPETAPAPRKSDRKNKGEPAAEAQKPEAVKTTETDAPATEKVAKKRGRPAKADKVVKAVEPRPVINEESAVPAKKRGRPAKADKVVKAVEPAQARAKRNEEPATPAKKRGRPAKPVVVAAPVAEKNVIVDELDADEKTGAEKRLDRGFGKKAEDAPKPRSKKGAEVVQPSVAIPVDLNLGKGEARPSRKAEQIEKERSRRHASLKTTMEIPIFSTPDPEASAPVSEDELTGELPVEYGETRIVMQIRDPHWAYVYWELPQIERKRLELEVGIFEFAHSHFVLRLHDVSNGYSQEIKLSEHARNWYLYLESSQTVYQVELGMQSPAEGYTFIALSNLLQTPPDQVSPRWAAPVLPDPEPVDRIAGHEVIQPVVEPEHVSPELARLTEPEHVYFSSLTGEKLAHPGSSDLLAGQSFSQPLMPSSQEHQPLLPLELPGSWQMPSSAMPTSHMPSSPVPTSGDWPSSDSLSSFNRAAGVPEQVSVSVAADVIFYGSVAPGCQLSFLGKPVKVRADGSYSLRLALPFNQDQQVELVATDPQTQKTSIIKAKITVNSN